MSPPQLATAPAEARSSRATAPITVVLADDHELVRRSLRLVLRQEEDVEVIAEARDLFTALRHVNGHLPHVLVLDLQMPDGSSIELIRQLHTRAPGTRVVVVTMEDSPAYARAAIAAGAVGFVLKEQAAHDLPAAVRCAARGEEYVSARVGARLDALQRSADDDGLSPREVEVLRLIALGFTSCEISEKLHLSRRTVESHRGRIQRKLGLTRRSELVEYALKRRLIGG
ncbi:MAG TPA: response regulator transcription factor [Solirubrobacteraceae bacterium]|nr:response regulator transcription factor [Solirubrobacteraceae bacterium]